MNSYKNKSLVSLGVVLLFIVLINFVGQHFYTRIDLTSEKKYTLSDITVTQLENLDDIVFFKLYIDGKELPVGLKKLRKNIEEMLVEMKVIGGENISYEFINPNQNSNVKERNQLFNQLVKKGLDPVNIQEKTEEGNLTQKTVFTGGFVYYKGQEVKIEFLTNNPTLNEEQNLNNAIQDIEFSLMSAIKKLNQDVPDKIAFIEGHGELTKMETADIGMALKNYYSIERVKIDEKIYALTDRFTDDSITWGLINKYKAIIIAGPTEKFSEKDKFIIDQYLMNGGNVLLLLNGTTASMDSLASQPFTMAMVKSVNLEDQLFTYGFRINKDIIQDIQCAALPIDVSPVNSKRPDYKMFPWPFFPLVSGNIQNSISKNLNLVKMIFASSIDTLGYHSTIKRTPLLFTSKNSKRLNAPVRIDLRTVSHRADPRRFTMKHLPTAYLAEGEFKSLYNGRFTDKMYQTKEIKFQSHSKPAKLLIVSDASIMRNSVKRGYKGYIPMPLEKDTYTGQTYGNKAFLINAVNYLCDDSGILNMRNKDFKIRLLDSTKTIGRKWYWQIINVLLPIVLLSLFAIIFYGVRRRKYKY